MRYVIGSDHAGFPMKEFLRRQLVSLGFEMEDAGVFDTNPADYPDVARAVARGVLSRPGDRGILVCGSGVGMSIVANRFRGIRAALCANETVAELSRRHNDANVLVLPGRFLTEEEALRMVKIWSETPFDGGRHQVRVEKIDA